MWWGGCHTAVCVWACVWGGFCARACVCIHVCLSFLKQGVIRVKVCVFVWGVEHVMIVGLNHAVRPCMLLFSAAGDGRVYTCARGGELCVCLWGGLDVASDEAGVGRLVFQSEVLYAG